MAKATKNKNKKKKVSLTFEATPGSEIIVAGTFNDWAVLDTKKAKKMKEESEGTFTLNMFLPTGEHEYKFYNDGQWINDPAAEKHKQNAFGTFNSVITVG